MNKLFLIATGGAIGALLRFFITKFFGEFQGFPLGTLVVNLTGCLLIGLLWTVSERFHLTANTNAFLFIGVLGAFTTFSTYGLESIQLLQSGKLLLAFAYIILSNIAGLLVVWVGKMIGNSLFFQIF